MAAPVAFDPNAPSEVVSVPAFDPNAPSDVVASEPGPEPRSFLARAKDRVGESFSNFGHAVAGAARGAVDLVSPISKTGGFQVPFGQLADPAYRHQVERGVSDTVTGGLAEKAANAASPEFAASAAPDAVAAPNARALGQAAGVALPSPFSKLAELGGVIPGTGPLASAARGAAGYELAAVPQAATQAAVNAPEGHRLEAAGHAALDAATDPASLAMGAGIPAVTSFLRRKLDVAAARAPEVQEAAKQRAVKDLGKDITSAEGVKSRVTDQKRIAEVNDRLYDLADKNPELRQAFSEPAEKALPKIQEFKAKLAEPLDRLYDAIDEKTGGGLDPHQVVGELRGMAKDARRTVSGLADSDRLGKLADQFEQVYVTEREPAAPSEEHAPQTHGIGMQTETPIQDFDTSEGGLFHTGLTKIDKITQDKHGLSMATTPEESLPYISNREGVIHRMELDKDARIANEKAIRAAAEEVGSDHSYVFEMADDPKVRKALTDDGFDAMKYDDLGPNNEYEHETVRLLNPDVAKIVDSARVKNGEILPRESVPSRGAQDVGDLQSALEQLRKLRENAKGVAAKGLDEQIAKLEGEQDAAAPKTEVSAPPTGATEKIPTRVFRHEVTELLKKSDSVMGGIEGTPRFEALQKLYDAGKQIIDKHIDGSGLPPDQIAQLRDINNGYFLLSRAEGAIESRGFKEANKPGYKFPTSVKAAAHSGGLAGIATAAALGGPHAVVHALPYVVGTELAAHALPAVAKSLNWQLAHGAYTRGVQRLIDLARKVPRAEFIGAAARVVGADGARRIYDAAQKPAAVNPASAPPNQDITL